MGLESLEKRGRDPVVGKTLGHVEVERWMADSDTGSLYFGHHTVSKAEVAVRVLKPEIVDRPGAKEKLLFEVRIAQQLNHPNVVRILEAGNAEGWTYVAMEFVRGEPLNAVVKREGRLDFDRATRMCREIARGLEGAHELELVHRDIRPANILIDVEGTPKINNFGLARRSSTGSGRTMVGELTGPPDFISPEQVEGAIVDKRSDLYSLGLTYYYMLTGQKPFEGVNDADIAKARLKKEVPIPENLPVAGRQLLARLTAPHPEARIATAHEVAVTCERALYGRDQATTPRLFVISPERQKKPPATKSERQGLTVLPTMTWVPPPRLRVPGLLYALALLLVAAGGGVRTLPGGVRNAFLAGAGASWLLIAFLILKQRARWKGAVAVLLGGGGLALAAWAATTCESLHALTAPINVLGLGAALLVGTAAECLRGYERSRGRRLLTIASLVLVAAGSWGHRSILDWIRATPLTTLPIMAATIFAVFCGVYLMPHPGASWRVRLLGVLSAFGAAVGLSLVAAGGPVDGLLGNLGARILAHGTAAAGTLALVLFGHSLLKSLP